MITPAKIEVEIVWELEVRDYDDVISAITDFIGLIAEYGKKMQRKPKVCYNEEEDRVIFTLGPVQLELSDPGMLWMRLHLQKQIRYGKDLFSKLMKLLEDPKERRLAVELANKMKEKHSFKLLEIRVIKKFGEV